LTALDQTSTSGSAVLRVVRQVGSCPTVFPGTVQVTVVVTDGSTGVVQATAATLIFVTGA
jgi:hypothetical protein